ncbi:hypothetical protein O0L34_g733 [Tuta absoluta]|nr:hypothetical protein O0L34_g733 [Tuta absoluta]
MAEYNCSYQRALTLYVAPSPPTFPLRQQNHTKNFNLSGENFVPLPGHSNDENRGQSSSVYTGIYAPLLQEDDEVSPTYADKITGRDKKEKAYSIKKQSVKQQQKEKGKKREKYFIGDNVYAEVDVNEEAGREQKPMDTESVSSMDAEDDNKSRSNDAEDRPPSFKELLDKLKYIIFIKRTGLPEKIRLVIKTTLDWMILQVVGYISDISFIKKMFNDGMSA